MKPFAHMEEIDLCWRAKNLGYTVKYTGASKVYHVGGATLSTLNPKKTFLNFRNSLFTLTKNARGNLFLLIIIRLLLDGMASVKFLLAFKAKHSLAILKAHFSYYKHLPQLLKQRKNLNQNIKHYQKTSVVMAYFVYKQCHYKRL